MKQNISKEQIAINNKRNRREFINAFKKSIGEFKFIKDYDYLEDFPYADFINTYKKNSVMVILDNYIKYINGISYSANNKKMIKRILNHILPVQIENLPKKDLDTIINRLDIIINNTFNSIDLTNLKELTIEQINKLKNKNNYTYDEIKDFVKYSDFLDISTYTIIFENKALLSCYNNLRDEEKNKIAKLVRGRISGYNNKDSLKILNTLNCYDSDTINLDNIKMKLLERIPKNKVNNKSIKSIKNDLKSNPLITSSTLTNYRSAISNAFKSKEITLDELEELFKLIDFRIKFKLMYDTIKNTSLLDEEGFKRIFYNDLVNTYNTFSNKEQDLIKALINEKIDNYNSKSIKKIKENLDTIYDLNEFTQIINNKINAINHIEAGDIDFVKELKSVNDYINKSNYISVSAYENTIIKINMLFNYHIISKEDKDSLLMALEEKINKYRSIGFNLLDVKEGKLNRNDFRSRVESNHRYSNQTKNRIILPQNNRNDFTNLDIFTIDDNVTMDLDDALSIKRLPNGTFEVYIIISDPTNLLRTNEFLYNEILNREESFYYYDNGVQYATNMYPDFIARDLLSINPGKLTNAHILKLNMTKDGEILNYDIVDGVVRSKERFTYERASTIIEEGCSNKARAQMLKDLYMISENFKYTKGYNKADEMVANLSTFTNYFISKLFKDKGLPYISLYSEKTDYDSRACYSAIASGHYHLGLSSYTHYTSPIRRATDSYMHDLVRTFFVDKQLDDKTVYENEEKIKKIVPLINKGRNEINYINK